MPRVSIIINVYNGAHTLRETLDSVISQTYDDWELIFWDDCSTDGSDRILDEYPDERIRYHRSSGDKASGLGPARRLAMQEAVGEWIAFVDQDDIWLPDKLELQMALADEQPDAGFIYGRTVTFLPGGRERDYDHRHEFRPLPEGDIFERLFIDSCFVAISSAIFRRAAVEAIDPIPDYILVSPDYYLYLELARRYPVRAVQCPICRYRIHGGNMSHYSGRRMQNEILQLLEHWEDCLEPRLATWRQQVHSTVLSLHEMRGRETFFQGLKTLLMRGSFLYLASRPFARAFRTIRRKIHQPYWQRENSRLTDTTQSPPLSDTAS